MSEIPDESRPGEGETATGEADLQTELKALAEWAKHAALTGKDLGKLAFTEIRLTMAESGRIAVLGLAMLPLAMLAWIGLSVLLGWWAYVPSQSVTLGLVAFLAVQIIPMLIMLTMIKSSSKNLGLTTTKQHIHAFRQGIKDGAQRPDQ
ncbi:MULTISPECIES: hypothetical protein [Pseudomonas]|uniref:hypothetical protein n=1 Tax=Pseudomonas TaxID=286 RepID=UPI001238D845|nr:MULTISPECIES: hypothetical protein [Pseudomonas]QIB49760.1 hypothetical protein G3M63_01000 [Pseudomonas sp. OIL-1]